MGPDSLLRQKVKQKRFREGYEDGLSSTHKATSALAFVMSDTPVEMLGQYSRCVPSLSPHHPCPGCFQACQARAPGVQTWLGGVLGHDTSGRILGCTRPCTIIVQPLCHALHAKDDAYGCLVGPASLLSHVSRALQRREAASLN